MLRPTTRTTITNGFLHLLESRCQTAIKKMQNLQNMVFRTLSANCSSFVFFTWERFDRVLLHNCQNQVCVCALILHTGVQYWHHPTTDPTFWLRWNDGTTACCSMFRVIANEVPSLHSFRERILHPLHIGTQHLKPQLFFPDLGGA